MFEVTYATGCLENPSTRKAFLQNVIALVKVTKGKNIILSSEASHAIYSRSPVDAMQVGMLAGMKQEAALDAVSTNCEAVFKHAHMRRTFKGAAELVSKDGDVEMKKA